MLVALGTLGALFQLARSLGKIMYILACSLAHSENSTYIHIREDYKILLARSLGKLSKPQPNHNTTQLNLTRVGFDMIITLHHPTHPPQELYFYQK